MTKLNKLFLFHALLFCPQFLLADEDGINRHPAEVQVWNYEENPGDPNDRSAQYITNRNRTPPRFDTQSVNEKNLRDNSYNTNRNFQSTQIDFYNDPNRYPTFEYDNTTPPVRDNYRTRPIRSRKINRSATEESSSSGYYYYPGKKITPGQPQPFIADSRDYYYMDTNMYIPKPQRLSETEMMSRLTRENRKIFLSLNEQGREIAIGLASDEGFDANGAVIVAAEEMQRFKESEGEN